MVIERRSLLTASRGAGGRLKRVVRRVEDAGTVPPLVECLHTANREDFGFRETLFRPSGSRTCFVSLAPYSVSPLQ
jgi:hypothetical protein